jgi:hypothetical protein
MLGHASLSTLSIYAHRLDRDTDPRLAALERLAA